MLKIKNILIFQKRWKNKIHWSVLQRKKNNVDRALESFDDFYGSVYGLRWRKMRIALLTEHKYIAMVNNFGDTDKISQDLELNGALNIKTLFELRKQNQEQEEEEEESLFSKKTMNNFDDKVNELILQQQTKEKLSIYPTDSPPALIPEKLEYQTIKPDDNLILNKFSNVQMKSSLAHALKENLEIDQTRIVNSNEDTGALHEYMPAHKIKGMEDWVPESEHYRYYQTNTDFPIQMVIDKKFTYPKHLRLYTYEKGNCSVFQPPKSSKTGVLTHFLMDGASILPALFLDVQEGDNVLDACAAPGGKSLLLLQTLYPKMLVCNDLQESRLNRVRRLMQQYICDFDTRWIDKRLKLNKCDARNLSDYDSYDKILVDVPCTTDRHVLNQNDSNLFKPTRIKERLRIPELQASILTNCLRLLKPGGTLVYSTCSLSPIQNDGVVHMALQRVFSEYGITAVVHDLNMLTRHFNDTFLFEQPHGLKYGQMVVPYLPANFGPIYFSKITRNT